MHSWTCLAVKTQREKRQNGSSVNEKYCHCLSLIQCHWIPIVKVQPIIVIIMICIVIVFFYHCHSDHHHCYRDPNHRSDIDDVNYYHHPHHDDQSSIPCIVFPFRSTLFNSYQSQASVHLLLFWCSRDLSQWHWLHAGSGMLSQTSAMNSTEFPRKRNIDMMMSWQWQCSCYSPAAFVSIGLVPVEF